MPSARKTVLEFLRTKPGGSTLGELSSELMRVNALGFGVEVQHVVSVLVGDGKIAYDADLELVILKL